MVDMFGEMFEGGEGGDFYVDVVDVCEWFEK